MKSDSNSPQQRPDPDAEERAQLAIVQQRLDDSVKEIDHRLAQYQQNIQEQKTYLWENKADMDHVEKVSTRQSIEQMLMTGDTILAQKKRLQKLARSPYFGRFDFASKNAASATPFYIGIHHFYDEQDKKHLVYDWRAPVASLFYDVEPGPATYQSPDGEVSGHMTLKRQFRIRDGKMEFMLESALNIIDDVLQQELARASDGGMQNIVATIQRDQNAIIRNEDAPTLIIQGVAGSGKTSIALHRIAFLLYRFKDTLNSSDILIISPNQVFANYIANVLPELGEESIAEIGMEQLADTLLEGKFRFQSFFGQTAALLEGTDPERHQRITAKASSDFVKKLGKYVEHIEKTRFVAEDILVAGRPVPAWFIEKHFVRCRGMGLAERITEVVKAVEVNMGIYYNHNVTSEERRTLRATIKKMHRTVSLKKLYGEFYAWLGQPQWFKPSRGKLEYADLFPLLYLKLRLEKVVNPYQHIKHLLIDEMQDYTPIQYAVLARLFPCRKTILGDVAQSVNPYSASSLADIQQSFRDATSMKLTRSYRSTLQIMEFVQRINFNPELQPLQRNGLAPQVVACRSNSDEMHQLQSHIAEFQGSEHQSLAIICKTQKRAAKIATALKEKGVKVQLLDSASRSFSSGVTVCSAHMAKGLEFDRVLIPDGNAATYHKPMDRNLLYVACTRAMHQLVLTYTAEPSAFIQAPSRES